MRRFLALGLLVASFTMATLAMAGAGAGAASSVPPDRLTASLSLTGVVDPFMANYVEKGIEEADQAGNAAVLLTIDTPGGLDSSMRQIVQAILAAHVPVLCYTAPSGARAASAGTFIMLACPINAMAPGTNIGAAHPVGISGAIEQDKATNDAVAYIRSLADQWDRNADWAEDAVRNSVSIPAEEAVQLNVADMIAGSAQELLADVDGRTITTADGTELAVETAGTTLEPVKMGLGASILHRLIDPNLAFLFFYLGLAMIIIEVLHPGVSVPGLLGALLLVSAFVSFGFLPVQLGGVVLLIVSAVFFLAELKHPGIGLPMVGGIIALVFGGLLLFNSSVPNATVSPWVVGTVAIGAAAFFGIVVSAVVRARRAPVVPYGNVVGQIGVALTDLDPSGQVRAGHEQWKAESTGDRIPKGASVRVLRREGLRLVVEPYEGAGAEAESLSGGGTDGVVITETAARLGGGREGE